MANPQKPQQQQQYGNAPSQPFTGVPTQGWRFEMFSCFDDIEECLDVFFLRWCKVGYMHGRMTRGIIGMDQSYCCGVFCCDMCTGGCASFCATWHLRNMMLTRYGIFEESIHTACFSLCCYPCALCQQAREMTVRGEPCGGIIASGPTQPPIMGGQQQGQPQQQQQQQQQGGYRTI